jgi:Fe-S cluster assembly protein SufD
MKQTIREYVIYNKPECLTYTVQSNEKLILNILQFPKISEGLVNSDLKIDLIGEGAEIEVRAAAFVTEGQKIKNQITVYHKAPNCQSNLQYKAVLQDISSEMHWIGDVVIEPKATGTSTYEENRNLLLTRGAKVISEPNLEILTGDIEKAGHASATGRFEDEQLFYLQSRGVDPKTAKTLVVEGFLYELIDQMNLQTDIIDKVKEFCGEQLKNQ